MPEIVLNDQDLKLMPGDVLTGVLAYIASKNAAASAADTHRSIKPAFDRGRSQEPVVELAELSQTDALKFLSACSEKTKKALRSIVRQGVEFEIAIIAADIGVHSGGLRGVWTGLTKRTRTITGKNDALLIDWFGEPTFNPKGEYANQKGRVSQMTYNSLERALDIDTV